VAEPVAQETCRLCGVRGRTSVIIEGTQKRLARRHVCKVVFLEPPPDEMAVTAEFEERHITSDDRLEKFFGSRRDPVLSFVANHVSRIKKRGHILDVGCAGGNSPKLSRLVMAKSRSLLGSGHLFDYNVASLTFLLGKAGFRVNEIMPVPAIKQRNAYQDLLPGLYYRASRSFWALSSDGSSNCCDKGTPTYSKNIHR
jgi:hypothetical protein